MRRYFETWEKQFQKDNFSILTAGFALLCFLFQQSRPIAILPCIISFIGSSYHITKINNAHAKSIISIVINIIVMLLYFGYYKHFLMN